MSVIKNTQAFSPEFLHSNYKHWAAIGLGTNLGDRAANLLRAISLLIKAEINILTVSDIYETAPEDYLDQGAFLNMVVLVASDDLLPPHKLLQVCLDIEVQLKRERVIDKGPRIIDLDLLIYDSLVIKNVMDLTLHYPDSLGFSLELILPHPRIEERGFVLVPLVELIPQALHPILGVNYQTLLKKLDLTGKVILY
ncbi:MAG: dihydroneopterin aldolase / 2-amino-4-hydroxy-6-hydroxymethyldihydropteridine diphosphokinase [bacterium]|nr:MAG: dihydroneopterin aldolase / 2-amino-4-hydroxy-6-hydroxymethyldihydropteridine diphosphokinase [bacterium]